MSRNNLLLLGGGETGSPQLAQSLIFNDDDNANLSWTHAAGANQKTFTVKASLKKHTSGTRIAVIGLKPNGTTLAIVGMDDNDKVYIYTSAGGTDYGYTTDAVLRDSSGWYEIVWKVDTTQATEADRMTIFVNGVEMDLTATWGAFPLNHDLVIGTSGATHNVGFFSHTSEYFDGVLADLHYIDGTAYDATEWGEFDDNGLWRWKLASGLTYGTTGFHYDFANSSGLGDDVSGNGNDATANNLASTDQVSDSPTVNYATMASKYRSADYSASSVSTTLSEGGLYVERASVANSNTAKFASQSIKANTGSWYWEVTKPQGGTAAGNGGVGVFSASSGLSESSNAHHYIYEVDGRTYISGVGRASFGAAIADNDVVGFRLDSDTGELAVYRNNSLEGTITLGGDEWWPCCTIYANTGTRPEWYFDFGQKGFAYSLPSSHKELNGTNFAADYTIAKPSDYFDALLYVGDGSADNDVTGLDFQPDFVWAKNRGAADAHWLANSVRGGSKAVSSNLNFAELAQNLIVSFDANGFSVGNQTNGVNTNTNNYASWSWRAGTSVSGTTTGSGTGKAYSGSVNTDAGFSIINYLGNGTSGHTIPHHLGNVPVFYHVKNLDTTSRNWRGYHRDLASDPETDTIVLNATSLPADSAAYWNDTAPTSSVITLGNENTVNTNNDNYILYAWAEVPGFSAFGAYTGNGSATAGPVVNCGFLPRFVLVRRISGGTGNWNIYDRAVNPYNSADSRLQPNSSNAESTSSVQAIDFTATGFQLLSNNTDQNHSGSQYIFAAFAEDPRMLLAV